MHRLLLHSCDRRHIIMSVTRAMTKQIRIQQWTEIFKDKAASGLKVKIETDIEKTP